MFPNCVLQKSIGITLPKTSTSSRFLFIVNVALDAFTAVALSSQVKSSAR